MTNETDDLFNLLPPVVEINIIGALPRFFAKLQEGSLAGAGPSFDFDFPALAPTMAAPLFPGFGKSLP